ncbi:MAG: histidine kinase dimerization/phosphoacceptor domain -containing protein [Hyphomicrobiaceae bacterium]|nr:histidine kinase dimerization/phosphoacceptor domain -containing protein [Hyphomicrobiaceae bacterium]
MSAASPRVLYIDDDPGICRLVQKALAARGMLVEYAHAGDAGIARLRQDAFDIVALDYYMPGQTGLQVLGRIKELPAPPPVVFVTGSDDSHVAVAALKAGAVDYVWKDAQGNFFALLAEAIGTALEKDRLRREKEVAEREVREARDRAEILLKEVNHRVANSLTIVASFVNLQRSRVDDRVAREVLETMSARVSAIAAVHRRLYTSDDVRSVDLREYLQHLVEELQELQIGEGRDLAIKFDSSPISLPTDKAVAFGIVVTELLTNACKYAYPATGRGEIRIRVSASGDDGCLVVEDDGVGLRHDAPSGTGLGSRIIGMMAASLGGSIDLSDNRPGVRATMSFKP